MQDSDVYRDYGTCVMKVHKGMLIISRTPALGDEHTVTLNYIRKVPAKNFGPPANQIEEFHGFPLPL